MKVQEILESGIRNTVFPGAVVGVCSATETEIWSAGRQTYSPDSLQVEDSTCYDVASVTKTIPTGLILWKLIETGSLRLVQPVQELLPNWQGKYKDQVQLWHLLAQAVRFEPVSLASLSVLGKQKLEQKILDLEIIEPPGTSYYFVNTTSILQTWILEAATGKPLDEMARTLFWEPLGMQRTCFFPTPTERTFIAPTEQDTKRGVLLHGKVHDESARVLSETGSAVGSAGLFSSVPDLLLFLQMILRGGDDIYKTTTVSNMFQPKIIKNGKSVGIGWELNNQEWMTKTGTNCFGKTGFTGCFIAVFPEKRKGVVMLSNAIHPTRQKDRSALQQIRRDILEDLDNFHFSHN